MSISAPDTQATAHSSSHSMDNAGEEGWDGYHTPRPGDGPAE